MLTHYTCFQCDYKGENYKLIRNQPLQKCFAINNVLEHMMCQTKNEKLKSMWSKQDKNHKSWQSKKVLTSNEIQIGNLIDVRDPNYIWCEAEIKMVIESAGRSSLLVITYKS